MPRRRGRPSQGPASLTSSTGRAAAGRPAAVRAAATRRRSRQWRRAGRRRQRELSWHLLGRIQCPGARPVPCQGRTSQVTPEQGPGGGLPLPCVPEVVPGADRGTLGLCVRGRPGGSALAAARSPPGGAMKRDRSHRCRARRPRVAAHAAGRPPPGRRGAAAAQCGCAGLVTRGGQRPAGGRRRLVRDPSRQVRKLPAPRSGPAPRAGLTARLIPPWHRTGDPAEAPARPALPHLAGHPAEQARDTGR
jgi:hypothetical protein